MKKKIFCLAFIFAYTFLVAALGGYFVNTASPWYNALVLPSFIPPPIVFAVAWTLIYIFSASAAFISCTKGEKGILYVYGLNGALNALWTYAFFEKENIALALWIIGLLILTLIYIIRNSEDIRSKVLNLPYLFWLLIAFILNYSIFMLN